MAPSAEALEESAPALAREVDPPNADFISNIAYFQVVALQTPAPLG
jgi:hypothetical protein